MVTPRGAATGLSGGSTPITGGMVLGLTRMNRILEIDEENLTATAESGVITVDLFNAAAARGLFYPPDPGSQNVSTLGGNVAENAGGLRGLKYGVTRNYVMALTGLLYDGTEFTDRGKMREGRRRLFPPRSPRRQRRDPRDHHRGHGPSDHPAAGQADAPRLFPGHPHRRRGGLQNHRRADHPRDPRNHGQDDDQLRRRLHRRSASPAKWPPSS